MIQIIQQKSNWVILKYLWMTDLGQNVELEHENEWGVPGSLRLSEGCLCDCTEHANRKNETLHDGNVLEIETEANANVCWSDRMTAVMEGSEY